MATWRWILRHASLITVLLPSGHSKSVCSGEAQCQAKIASLVDRLDATRQLINNKHSSMHQLDEVRSGMMSGNRIELPSALRQHLEASKTILSEISYDARHKPVSSNFTQHFSHVQTLAKDTEVRFHAFMPLKKTSSPQQKAASPSGLLVVIDKHSTLSLYALDGAILVDKLDLGHAPGTMIKHVAVSPSQDNHFVVTADSEGEMRSHSFKVLVTKASPQANKTEKQSQGPPQLQVTSNFTGSLMLPPGSGSEPRKITALMTVDRGSSTYIVTGDTLGGIAVFHRNGTMKGRVRVTEDPAGVKGLMRGQGQTVLFYSSHSFGFFSTAQLDVQSPPCSGWNSPVFDVAVDPTLTYSRVILSLMDGDVIVFATQRGKAKACDLSLKFPHVSTLPFKLHMFRGHVLGLPMQPEGAGTGMGTSREMYFFNVPAMEVGYGVSHSRAVALQVSFRPKQPEDFALLGVSSGERAKSQIALRFENAPGVELYELSLKQPAAPKSPTAEGSGDSANSWLNWFPKIGVFGIALVGVVIWNVRKATGQQRQDRFDDFDEDAFKEKLARREKGRAEDHEEPRVEELKGGDGDGS